MDAAFEQKSPGAAPQASFDASSPLLESPSGCAERQFLVLSSAGKPIFSLGVDAQQLHGLAGLLRGVLAYGETGMLDDAPDALTSISTDDLQIQLLTRGALLFVAASRRPEDHATLLQLQLEILHHQILAMLTSRVQDTLERKPGSDIRALLGAAAPLPQVVVQAGADASLGLDAVPSLCLTPQLRAEVQRVLTSKEVAVPACLCAALCCKRSLLGLAQMRREDTRLWASDLLLAMNFVVSQKLGLGGEETWTPLCLPRFRATSNAQVYVGVLDARAHIYLLMVSHDNSPDVFDALRKSRQAIHGALRRDQVLPRLAQAVSHDSQARAYYNYCKGSAALHFFYKKHAIAPPSQPAATSRAAPGQCIFHGFYFPFIDASSKARAWLRYRQLALRLRRLPASQEIAQAGEAGQEYGDAVAAPVLDALGRSPTAQVSLHADGAMLYTAIAGGGQDAPQGAAWELYCTFPCGISVDQAVTKCSALGQLIQSRDESHFVSQTSVWS